MTSKLTPNEYLIMSLLLLGVGLLGYAMHGGEWRIVASVLPSTIVYFFIALTDSLSRLKAARALSKELHANR